MIIPDAVTRQLPIRGSAPCWDRILGVANRKDRPFITGDSRPIKALKALLRSGALAAGLLENACGPGPGDPLRLEVVRTLARSLKGELEALAALADKETSVCIEVVEGALRAADVANLAACTLPELVETGIPRAAAATYLAAGTVQALGALAEADVEDTCKHHAQNALKDVRGAEWRARLAARQVEEFMGKSG
jgi:hypothetical protein